MQKQIEELAALYLAPEFEEQTRLIRGEKVFRVEVGGMRHYRRENGRIYRSLTTFLRSVMPPSQHLTKWREKMTAELGSTEAVTEWMQNVADYGTALHIMVADYCRNGGVNWKEAEDWAFGYLQQMGLKATTLSMAHTELIKDFASLLQFFHDYDVKVLAVEIPVFLDCGIATLVDLVVEMNALQYTDTLPEKRKRVRRIINLKSGKKGFFEEHLLQLVGERAAFNETFAAQAGFKVENVANLAPSDWRDAPTYKFKDQTKGIVEGLLDQQFFNFVDLAKLRGVLSVPSKKYPIFIGFTAFGQSPVDQMRLLDYSEFVTTQD